MRISEYFYGARRELYPHSSTLDFAALRIFTIGVAQQAPSSALPIGMKIEKDQLAAKQVRFAPTATSTSAVVVV